MKYFWIFFALFWMPYVNASSVPQETTHLTVSVNAPGTSPLLYFDQESDSYQGVVVDFFASFDSENGFKIVYLDTSRARYEPTIINKKADMFISAKAWLNNTKYFIYSDALVTHDSHVYAAKKFTADFIPAKFREAKVCTRVNFTYPFLDPYFDSGELIRIDSTNQSTTTEMLAKGRCDFLVMGSEDARAELFREKYCSTEFFESPNTISSVDMVLVMNPELARLQSVINDQIARFIASGARDISIRRHAEDKRFPKQRCL